jgi:hypothetical protein
VQRLFLTRWRPRRVLPGFTNSGVGLRGAPTSLQARFGAECFSILVTVCDVCRPTCTAATAFERGPKDGEKHRQEKRPSWIAVCLAITGERGAGRIIGGRTLCSCIRAALGENRLPTRRWGVQEPVRRFDCRPRLAGPPAKPSGAHRRSSSNRTSSPTWTQPRQHPSPRSAGREPCIELIS